MAEKTHHLAEVQPLLSRLEADGIEYALIGVMERLPLHKLELTELEVTGSAIRLSDVTILDPFTLLLTKLAALHERPQGEINHDDAHCAILSDVIPRFLEDALSKHQSRQTDYDPATDAWRLLRVLKRGNHPLPGDEAANSRFVDHLEAVTLNWLSQTDREMPGYRASSSSPR